MPNNKHTKDLIKINKKIQPDPALQNLITQQVSREEAMKELNKLPHVKQRDVGNPIFNYQGPMGFAGPGTKDRMPGTTPLVEAKPPNIVEWLLDALKIRKRGYLDNLKKIKIKAKGTGNLV